MCDRHLSSFVTVVARARHPAPGVLNPDYVMRLSYTTVLRKRTAQVGVRDAAYWRKIFRAWTRPSTPSWRRTRAMCPRARAPTRVGAAGRGVPAREPARRIHARVILRDARRRSVELALIEYYYLSVRIVRAQWVVPRYVPDTRLADAW